MHAGICAGGAGRPAFLPRLKEIADVLHHRSLNTTQIYTKVALGELSGVAMPWPRRSS